MNMGCGHRRDHSDPKGSRNDTIFLSFITNSGIFMRIVLSLDSFFIKTQAFMKQEHIGMNDNSVHEQESRMIKEEIAIIALAVWLTLLAVLMVLTQSISLEIFFVLSLIGFLIITELITPKYIRPGYVRYIQDILAVGMAIFVVIVVQKVIVILAK